MYQRKGQEMKKASIVIIITLTILCLILCATNVHAASKVLDEKTESTLVEIKDNAANL